MNKTPSLKALAMRSIFQLENKVDLINALPFPMNIEMKLLLNSSGIYMLKTIKETCVSKASGLTLHMAFPKTILPKIILVENKSSNWIFQYIDDKEKKLWMNFSPANKNFNFNNLHIIEGSQLKIYHKHHSTNSTTISYSFINEGFFWKVLEDKNDVVEIEEAYYHNTKFIV